MTDSLIEVDFVVAGGSNLWAIEVKSGRAGKTSGLSAFRRQFPHAHCLLIGGGGIPLEEFLLSRPESIFGN